MSNPTPFKQGVPKAPGDIRVCLPGVVVRLKNASEWNPLMSDDPGNGKVLQWEAGNGRNGVRVAFAAGTLLCSTDEIELVDCDETRAALVEGVLADAKVEAVQKAKDE